MRTLPVIERKINMSRRNVIKAAAATSAAGLVPGLSTAVYAQGSDKPEKEEVRIGFIPLTDCASVVMATREARRPIVLFTEDEDTSHVGAAIAAGVTAYVVAGMAPDRVKPVLEVALARFQHEEGLRRELADARTELSDRKVIDRAKGILIRQHGLTEQDAYARLRKTAMDKGLRLAEVAQRLIDVSDLLA